MPPRGYTISKLAKDAGISTGSIRNYQMRGMVRPCECAECGYGIYDESALTRLRFIRAGMEAGIELSDLESLCKALDRQEEGPILQELAAISEVLNGKLKILAFFKSQLDDVNLCTVAE